MKKILSIFISLVTTFSFFSLNVGASFDDMPVPYVVDFSLTTGSDIDVNDVRATGLISSYGLSLSKNSITLNISGRTNGSVEVVRTGFKDLTVQRRASSADAWEDYYEYGNLYVDAVMANLETTLVVESGYQYRISCKHYAKKNLLSVQTIANTSNIVTVS